MLDEPTIGLHPRDNARLLDSLGTLRDQAATRSSSSSTTRTPCASPTASSISGPARARRAAQIVARGLVENAGEAWRIAHGQNPRQAAAASAARQAPPVEDAPALVPDRRRAREQSQAARRRRFRPGRFVALCGVSGAGKSTLLHDVIKPAAQAFARRAKASAAKAADGPVEKARGLRSFHLASTRSTRRRSARPRAPRPRLTSA